MGESARELAADNRERLQQFLAGGRQAVDTRGEDTFDGRGDTDFPRPDARA